MTTTNNEIQDLRETDAATRQSTVVRLRIWPALIIALAQVIAVVLFTKFGRTNIHNGIALGGIPLVAAILMLVWWIAASRVPWRSRIAGFVLFFVAIAAVLFSQRSVSMGGMLLAVALPYLLYSTVITLVVTIPFAWRTRKWLLAIVLFLCAGVFCAQRVDEIGGDLYPVVSWRWQMTSAQRSENIGAPTIQQTAELPDAITPEDWCDFLGQGRKNTVTNLTFSTDWTTPPREVWRQPIGPGWSSFIGVGDYLFTQEQRGDAELVTCYRADTGASVWQQGETVLFDDAMGLGPRATPVFHEGHLYTQGATGLLQCLDAATGDILWKRQLTEDGDTGIPAFAFASSPLVVDELVVAFTAGSEGKSVIAYHRETGEIAWSTGPKDDGYASPQLSTVVDTPQILIASNFGIQGIAAENGAVLWKHAWDIERNPRCVQPAVWKGEYVLFGGTGTSGSRLLHVTRTDDSWNVEEAWSQKKFGPYFNNGILYKDHYYGYDDVRLGCLVMETGERAWTGERFGGQLLFVKDMEMLLVLSERGDLALVRAVPDRFEEVAQFKALNGKTWNHPIIHHGKLYVRNSEEAACFELPGLAALP
jgi:outer membrane protein assembly factor BamB